MFLQRTNEDMKINLPDIKKVISLLVNIESSFDGETHKIQKWVEKNRDSIRERNKLIEEKSDKNDIKILIFLLTDLLIRAMKGEIGTKVFNELQKLIKTKKDLNYENYVRILKNVNYRWGAERGAKVIEKVANLFANEYNWNWAVYFNDAEKYFDNNFIKDKLLKIKYVKFKVRDLALSSFNKNYIANDLHVVRVITRIGLLNYGFTFLRDNNLEMGNDPDNKKNYLFLHKLILKLSKLTYNEYSPADLDRIFWHFGRSICKAKPNCSICPIKDICLTGQYRN